MTNGRNVTNNKEPVKILRESNDVLQYLNSRIHDADAYYFSLVYKHMGAKNTFKIIKNFESDKFVDQAIKSDRKLLLSKLVTDVNAKGKDEKATAAMWMNNTKIMSALVKDLDVILKRKADIQASINKVCTDSRKK